MLCRVQRSLFPSFKAFRRTFVTKFTKEHEWLKVKGNVGIFGITDYAQKALGDLVYIELPKIGSIKKGDPIAAVESVKAASDVYAPVDGKIIKVNDSLDQDPRPVNTSPFDEGWIAEIEISDLKQLDGLMSEGAYNTYIQ